MADRHDKGPIEFIVASGTVPLLAPVAVVGGLGVVASNLNPAHRHAVRGVNTVAAVDGETLRVQVLGPLITGGTSWVEGPLYVGDGVLTQTRPASGFIQIIAYADTATRIYIAPHEPTWIANYDFSFGDPTRNIMHAPAGYRVISAKIIIKTAFNGAGASLKIGDAGNAESIMAAAGNDPTLVSVFATEPAVQYSVATPILFTINPGAGATQGSGSVVVEIAL